jgi:hypothetical protein
MGRNRGWRVPRDDFPHAQIAKGSQPLRESCVSKECKSEFINIHLMALTRAPNEKP